MAITDEELEVLTDALSSYEREQRSMASRTKMRDYDPTGDAAKADIAASLRDKVVQLSGKVDELERVLETLHHGATEGGSM
jgi:hypothetical protein